MKETLRGGWYCDVGMNWEGLLGRLLLGEAAWAILGLVWSGAVIAGDTADADDLLLVAALDRR